MMIRKRGKPRTAGLKGRGAEYNGMPMGNPPAGMPPANMPADMPRRAPRRRRR